VLWAVQSGLLSGITSETVFQPADPITREQIAVMFFRFAALSGCDMTPRADLSVYSDHTSITPFALGSMQWAVGIGLFKGSAGKMNPDAGATRCEVATLFQRLNELLLQRPA